MSAAEADTFMRSFLAKCVPDCVLLCVMSRRYPTVAQFQHFCIRRCEQQGYVETILNRRRTYAKINSSNASGCDVIGVSCPCSTPSAAMRSGLPSTL